jgi:hypothetical protein
MNVKQKLVEMLVMNGLFESQAETILELAIPVLNEQADNINGTTVVDGKEIPVSPYKITWDSPANQYPQALYTVWYFMIKPIAYAWLKKNKPQAWCLQMFAPEV